MALTTSTTGLVAKTIADMAYVRLYDSFPLSYVSRATGPNTAVVPTATTESTGATATNQENQTLTVGTTWQPTIQSLTAGLKTYRAAVAISNELLEDSGVLAFMASRLSGQIVEKAATDIVSQLVSDLNAASRTTQQQGFTIGTIGDDPTVTTNFDHSAFQCLSRVHNYYREQACWIMSPKAFRQYGTSEGRGNLVTIPFRSDSQQRTLMNAAALKAAKQSTGADSNVSGFGYSPSFDIATEAGGAGGGPVLELSKQLEMQRREVGHTSLQPKVPDAHGWATAYLGCPIHTSTGLGDPAASGAVVWMMLVDLSAFLWFEQPLQIQLDTQTNLTQNQTIVYATYRGAGKLMEPTAGWALKTPA